VLLIFKSTFARGCLMKYVGSDWVVYCKSTLFAGPPHSVEVTRKVRSRRVETTSSQKACTMAIVDRHCLTTVRMVILIYESKNPQVKFITPGHHKGSGLILQFWKGQGDRSVWLRQRWRIVRVRSQKGMRTQKR
jgi:hypothetical protein